MKKNLKYLYIGIVLIVLILYGVLTFFFVTAPEEEQTQPSPTAFPGTPTPIQKETPLDTVQEQSHVGRQLTQKEKLMRQEWVNNVTETGRIYETDTFGFYYLADYDTFQIRIFSSDIEKTKQDALQWLQEVGFSINGICKLPVLFYANPRILPESASFNSIPEMCQ